MYNRKLHILVVSNEYTNRLRIGNPIIERIINSTKNDERVETVDFIPFQNKINDLLKIRKRFANKEIDIIHIQFGGLYAFIIWMFLIGVNKPKIITFHGTDLHAGELATTTSLIARTRIRLNRLASIISFYAFDRIGAVSNSLFSYVPSNVYSHNVDKLFVQQLGVDYSLFKEKNATEAQKRLGIPSYKYILFSDKSNTPIKRKDIAEEILSRLEKDGYKLLVMCGVSPKCVPDYINSSEAILITSDMEGSPNIVREGLALNKRVFSVNVGDVQEQISGLNNSCIISSNPIEASVKIIEYMARPYTDNTSISMRNRLDLDLLTAKVVDVYIDALKN